LVFSSFISPSSAYPLVISFPSLPFSLLPSVFAPLTFPALISTAYHTPLDILSSSPLLFSNQFQDYSELAMAFPKLYSTSNLQSH